MRFLNEALVEFDEIIDLMNGGDYPIFALGLLSVLGKSDEIETCARFWLTYNS